MKEVLSKQAVKIAKRAEEHESFINKVCLLRLVHAFNQKCRFYAFLFIFFILFNFIFFIIYGHLGM